MLIFLKSFVFIYWFGFSFAEYLSLNGNNDWFAISFNKCKNFCINSYNIIIIIKLIINLIILIAIKTKAKVPGSIYSDLRREGILKDLYVGKNDVNYRWVSYDNLTYE